MKLYAFSLIFIILLVFSFGCNSDSKTLDWSKTAKQQKLKIGDTISVEGVVYDPIGRDIKPGRSSGEFVWVKQEWKAKTYVSVYNPDEPDDSPFNPNAPIGVVFCTIYNPSAYKGLQRLADMYSDRSPTYPMYEHRLRFVGTINSFERKFVESYNENPDVYLNCVRMDVTALDLINSQLIPPDSDKYDEWK